jgi:hypothetical protein
MLSTWPSACGIRATYSGDAEGRETGAVVIRVNVERAFMQYNRKSRDTHLHGQMPNKQAHVNVKSNSRIEWVRSDEEETRYHWGMQRLEIMPMPTNTALCNTLPENA